MLTSSVKAVDITHHKLHSFEQVYMSPTLQIQTYPVKLPVSLKKVYITKEIHVYF